MCFLREGWLRAAVEDACRAEGLEPAGWREVPTRTSALGVTALASLPRIEQLVLAPRRTPTPSGARTGRGGVPSALPASTSLRSRSARSPTRRCARPHSSPASTRISRIPALAVPFAIFHQRFSTNTEPSWERAQPFRLLCHNGEINTIDGNVTWTEARQRALGVEPALAPALDRTGPTRRCSTTRSSSLVRGAGADPAEALSVLVPPAWQNDPRLERRRARLPSLRRDAQRAVGRAGGARASRTAASCGAALDRNGLRPLRVAVAGDGLVAVASEAGAVPLPDGAPVRADAARPGRHARRVDPDRGLLIDGASSGGDWPPPSRTALGRGAASSARDVGDSRRAAGGARSTRATCSTATRARS